MGNTYIISIVVALWFMVFVPNALAEARIETGKTFRDCPDCPEMVVIPAGSFFMGSKLGRANETPVHKVAFKYPFAIGKTEVTQGEWHALMGNNPSSFPGCGEDCPVDQISWEDAHDYIHKLNQKTGKQYRLPSEAEWEYASNSGDVAVYSCGNDPFCWYRDNATQKVMKPVGKGQPNRNGLHDMHENVWEWTDDCWNDNFEGAPSDGRIWKTGDCSERVLRGGTNVHGYILETSNRHRGEIRYIDKLNGLRVVRTLETKLSPALDDSKIKLKTEEYSAGKSSKKSSPSGLDFSVKGTSVEKEKGSKAPPRTLDFSLEGTSVAVPEGEELRNSSSALKSHDFPKKYTEKSPSAWSGTITSKIMIIIIGLLLGYWVFARWSKKKSVSSTSTHKDSENGAQQNKPHNEEQSNNYSDKEDNIPANWFYILEVPEDASQEQIVAAYKQKIRQYHPDKVAQMGTEIRELAEHKSKLINAAYNHAMKLQR